MIKAFIKAARLRTLPLSISGIIVGSSIAFAEGYLNWTIFVLAILTTIGFQVLSNFANDYGDGVKGTDNDDRIGPKRALQSGEISPKQMLNAIKTTGIITFLIALLLVYTAFGKENIGYFILFVLLGIASIIAAIKYTMGSKAYGYSGFGDIFVFLFFGLLAVVGSYFLYTKQLNYEVFLLGVTVGLLSTGVLNLNNMRDRISDEKANKHTLVVKIGATNAKYYHYALLILSFLFSVIYIFLDKPKIVNFLFILAFIPIAIHFKTVYNNKDPKLLDPELKKLALSTFLFAILFSVGQLL